MAVTDGVFGEGTFDNATFNNVSRSEENSLNSAVSRTGEFQRLGTESFSLDGSVVKQAAKSVGQGLNVADFNSVFTGKTRTESAVLDRAVAKKVSKRVTGSLNLSDLSDVFTRIFAAEVFSIVDFVGRIGKFYRREEEFLNAATSLSRSHFILNIEQFTASADVKKGVGKVSKESVDLNDLEFFKSVKIFNESLNTFEENRVFAGAVFAEDAALTDSHVNYLSRELSGKLQAADKEYLNLAAAVSDDLTLESVYEAKFLKKLNQSLTVSPGTKLLRTLSLVESVNVSENLKTYEVSTGFASTVDISKLHKAVASFDAARKAVVDLDISKVE